MSRVLTNKTNRAFCVEETPGVLPAEPVWKDIEPNTSGSFGAKMTNVARDPISKNRQRRQGATTDLDSMVELEGDLTMDHLEDFLPGFLFAELNGPASFSPTAVTTTGYTVASGGDLTAGWLVYARGFSVAANNGLKVITAGSTATEIRTTDTEVAETPDATDNATVEVCGVQFALGDASINSDGNLVSAVLDFTTLGLTVGQVIWVGGGTTATQFFNAANTGWARITAIAANLLTLDKKTQAFATDDGTATGSGGTNNKTIQIFYGKFGRNVAIDDADFVEKTYQFEAEYPDLGGVGTDEYEYAIGNYANEMKIEVPGQALAKISFNFIGEDTEAPTTVRANNAEAALTPVKTAAFNTSADIARLRITETDETGITTDFKNFTLSIRNNVTPEKILGTLGAAYMNYGNFEVDVEASVLFTDSDVISAIRANRAITMDFSLTNDDGGVFVDIPSCTLGDGTREMPKNESVLVSLKIDAFQDATLGTSIGISLFPYLP